MREAWRCRACSRQWTRAASELTGCPACGSPDTFHVQGCVGELAAIVESVGHTLASLGRILASALTNPRTLLKLIVIFVGGILVIARHLLAHLIAHAQ